MDLGGQEGIRNIAIFTKLQNRKYGQILVRRKWNHVSMVEPVGGGNDKPMFFIEGSCNYGWLSCIFRCEVSEGQAAVNIDLEESFLKACICVVLPTALERERMCEKNSCFSVGRNFRHEEMLIVGMERVPIYLCCSLSGCGYLVTIL